MKGNYHWAVLSLYYNLNYILEDFHKHSDRENYETLRMSSTKDLLCYRCHLEKVKSRPVTLIQTLGRHKMA